MTAYIFKIISLLGGLALFLFGMDVMGKALERQAGGRLQTILAKQEKSKTAQQGNDLENICCHICLLYGKYSYFDKLHYKIYHL